MTSTVQQGFPNVTAPFVNPQGVIQQSWLQLLISLWTRTGSGSGSFAASTGDIKASVAPGDQEGWFECDGRAISRTTYSGLFKLIGITYGPGDGVTTFNIPDYRHKFLLGADPSFPLATTGGSFEHELALTEIPNHNHPIIDPGHTHIFTANPHTHTVTDPGHNHTDTGIASNSTPGTTGPGPTAGTGFTSTSLTGITIDPTTVTGTNATATTGITTGAEGGNQSFSILNPYYSVTWLIKT